MFVQYKDEKIELSEGSSGKDLVEKLNLRGPDEACIISVNGKLQDLASPLNDGDRVDIYNFSEPEGKEVFWHTSAHVLAQAILRLYPDAKPTIGPPIDKGFYYDFANLKISEEDFPKIEKEMKAIISENFKPELVRFKNRDEALTAFSDNPYKKELIEGFDEDAGFTAYRQGEFFDLCRGPHLFSLGKIKALKLTKTSGAYWRGDSDREMLTRIYGITFPDKKQLKDYLFMLEEAKKRDHRMIGTKLDLYSFSEAAPSMPFIHPKGMEMWNRLLDFWRQKHHAQGYEEIKTPQLMSKNLWIESGHWAHYRENMYTSEIEEQEFALKPMNCPGCMLYFRSRRHSYRDLPRRIGEIGHVHRHEPSGAINGMFRVRSFHQDDAHIFMKPEDIKGEILEVLKLTDDIYHTFGLNYRLELSTRPTKGETIGTDEEWERATEGLRSALEEWGRPFAINEGDGAFYGPKIDLHIHDAIGRSWQCGTVQLDMSLPEKFNLEYTDRDGELKRPIMIHRALFGSIERFFGILVEHFAGKFPLWLSPRPLRIIIVADRHLEYAQELMNTLHKEGFLCEIDDTSESVGKKVRLAQMEQVNYMITVGDQEIEKAMINLRTRNNVVHGEITLESFLEKIKEERDTRSLNSLFVEQMA